MKKIIRATLSLVLALSLAILGTSCKNDKENDVGVKSYGASQYYETWKPFNESMVHYVKIDVKDCGDIILLLDASEAPATVANFLQLVSDNFYDGLTFHRIIKNFMIQGGDPKADGTGNSKNTVDGEFWDNGYFFNRFQHLRGVISMARGDDMNSASCQFFICNADSPHLNDKYAAFGFVICGMSVVDYITEKTVGYVDTSSGTISDKKKQAVINSIEEITKEEALAFVAASQQQ